MIPVLFLFSFLGAAFFFGGEWMVRRLRAFPLTESRAPEIYTLTQRLAGHAGLPPPDLYLMPSASANFAAVPGFKRGRLILTQGLFETLNAEEFSAVIAWGLARISRRGLRFEILAALLACTLRDFQRGFNWLLGLGSRSLEARGSFSEALTRWLILPPAALMVRIFARPPARLRADREAADRAGNPLYLASALSRLDAAAAGLPLRGLDPALDHLFIVSPVSRRGMERLYSTHLKPEFRMADLERRAPAPDPAVSV